jgi:hypothetical protein
VETPIGNGIPADIDAQGLSAIDDQNELFYLVSFLKEFRNLCDIYSMIK